MVPCSLPTGRLRQKGRLSMERIHGNAGVSAVHPALSSFSTSIHPGDQPCQCAAGTMRMLCAVNGGCSLYASGEKLPLIGPAWRS